MQQLGPSLDAVYLKVGTHVACVAPAVPDHRSLSASSGSMCAIYMPLCPVSAGSVMQQ